MGKKSQFTRREFIEASALTGMSLAVKAEGRSDRVPGGEDRIDIVNEGTTAPKLVHGISYLSRALEQAGVPYRVQSAALEAAGNRVIRIGVGPANLPPDARRGEAFSIKSRANVRIPGHRDGDSEMIVMGVPK